MAFAKACKILAGQPSPRFLRIAPFSLSTISSRKKSARELRQGRSDYRCCIPALAGFVSPQSIAPDGTEKFAKESRRAITNCDNEDEPSISHARRSFITTVVRHSVAVFLPSSNAPTKDRGY